MESLQKQFLTLLEAAGPCREEFLLWLRGTVPSMLSSLSGAPGNGAEGRLRLTEISRDIRENLPLEAIFPSEQIQQPDGQRSFHLDAFLYDEEDEERLVEEGKLSRFYCGDCGSENNRQIRLFTHSCSKDVLEYIFRNMLPPNLERKTIVDVGSRIGAVLYGAYVFSSASRIIGIEMNQDMCLLQEQIINKYRMTDRVQVVRGELTSLPGVIAAADVVILNNVFEWFMNPEMQVKMWQFLRQFIKPGTLLVTVPSLQESLQHLPAGISLENWVMEINPASPSLYVDDEDDETHKVKLYQVIHDAPLIMG